MCKQQWVNCFRKNGLKSLQICKQFMIARDDVDDRQRYIIRMLNDRDLKLYDDFCLNVFKFLLVRSLVDILTGISGHWAVLLKSHNLSAYAQKYLDFNSSIFLPRKQSIISSQILGVINAQKVVNGKQEILIQLLPRK